MGKAWAAAKRTITGRSLGFEYDVGQISRCCKVFVNSSVGFFLRGTLSRSSKGVTGVLWSSIGGGQLEQNKLFPVLLCCGCFCAQQPNVVPPRVSLSVIWGCIIAVFCTHFVCFISLCMLWCVWWYGSLVKWPYLMVRMMLMTRTG